MNILTWLYETIPFMQFMGTRANIIGVLWFLCLITVTFHHLIKNKYYLETNKKYLYYLGIVSISTVLIWVFYRAMDVGIAMWAVIVNQPQIVGNFTLYFWCAEAVDIIMIIVAAYYILHVLNVKPFFSSNIFSKWIFLSVLLLQFYVVKNFPIDYAGLTGVERIRVFWSYYPLLYSLYAVLFYTFVKRKHSE